MKITTTVCDLRDAVRKIHDVLKDCSVSLHVFKNKETGNYSAYLNGYDTDNVEYWIELPLVEVLNDEERLTVFDNPNSSLTILSMLYNYDSVSLVTIENEVTRDGSDVLPLVTSYETFLSIGNDTLTILHLNNIEAGESNED